MKLKTFKIKNRYGQCHIFNEVSDNLYEINPFCDYFRIIYEEDNVTINAIDPDGGPFMSRGYIFENGKILKDIVIINNKVLLRIENNNTL